MAKKLAYTDRDFLNDPGFGNTAVFHAQLENSYQYKDGECQYYNYIQCGEFKVTDCYKAVTLELDFNTPEETINSISKLMKLRDAADRMIEKIQASNKHYEKPE